MAENELKKRPLMPKLMGATRLHHVLAESKISQLGLHRSQHHMLMCISRNRNMCQKDLAEMLEISPAATAVTLKKLESEGLITRESEAEDSRVNRITITEKGEELVKKTQEIFKDIDSQIYSCFTEEELDTFEVLVSKLKDSIKKAINNSSGEERKEDKN